MVSPDAVLAASVVIALTVGGALLRASHAAGKLSAEMVEFGKWVKALRERTHALADDIHALKAARDLHDQRLIALEEQVEDNTKEIRARRDQAIDQERRLSNIERKR
jgi:septal ring factor EnvC (AmiA/AmiB activator)